jgi:thiol-disulfide isomerase/thioredoxin
MRIASALLAVSCIAMFEPGLLFAADTQPSPTTQKSSAVVVTGRVVDSQTGRPIEKFTVVFRMHRVQTGGSWSRFDEGAHGRYEVAIRNPADTYTIRLEADGYLPLESKPLAKQPAIRFDGRMVKGKPLSGVVLKPDGTPASEAQVGLGGLNMILAHNGRIAPAIETKNGLHLTHADAKGRFILPPREGRVTVFVVHDAGWIEFSCNGQDQAETVTLHKWCVVEGSVSISGAAASGRKVTLSPFKTDELPEKDELYSVRRLFGYDTEVDQDGHFIFDRVIDGPSMFVVQFVPPGPGPEAWGFTSVIDLKPGEHRQMKVGGTGMPVVGKVVLPAQLNNSPHAFLVGRLTLVRPVFVPPDDYWNLPEDTRNRIRKTGPNEEYERRPHEFVALFQPDGSFRADDIPTGEYKLAISAEGPMPDHSDAFRALASMEVHVSVPGVEAGNVPQPLDVGTLKLVPYQYPDAGTMIPTFSAQTLDGNGVNFSDLRGKYVILDFWATWCAPCIAGFSHVAEIKTSLADDPRWIIVSASVDDSIDQPRRLQRDRKLTWPQWYVGPLHESAVVRQLGINHLPSIWLIAPDGKIVAKDLTADKLDQAIREIEGQYPNGR